MIDNPPTTKILGKQVLDELGLRGQLYAIFDKSEKETLNAIETRRELRAFLDQSGFDCVPALGTPRELLKALKRGSWPNSRCWPVDSRGNHYAKLVAFSVTWTVVNYLLRPEEGFRHIAAGAVGFLIVFVIVTMIRLGVARYRRRCRQQIHVELRETEAHLYSSHDTEPTNQPLVAELSQ